MKMKLIAMLTAFTLCSGAVPVLYPAVLTAQAEEETADVLEEVKTFEDFEYQVIDNQIQITKYLQSNLIYAEPETPFDEIVVIPEEIDGLPVTKIGAGAFFRSKCSEIQIPDTVTEISTAAFRECKNLEKFNFPASLKTIGNAAFSGTALKEVHLPDALAGADFGENIFLGCENLKTATLPQKIETIPSGIFEQCHSLETVVIPETVKTIEKNAFGLCWNLQNVEIPSGVTSIGSNAFSGCWKNLTEVTIPDTVTEIGEGAFSSCKNLKTIHLPEHLNEISFCMLMDTGISEFTVPETIQSIDYAAFAICSQLRGITFLNPECEIAVSATGMGRTISTGAKEQEDNQAEEYFNGIIYGYAGSTAQDYAEIYNYKFEALDAPALETGDIDGSGNIDILDVIVINKAIMGKEFLSKREISAVDFNDNGIPDNAEALTLLKYIVGLITELT